MEMMLAVTKPRPEPGCEVRLVPVPVPREGEVLVKVMATSVCGTDLHIFKWDSWAAGRLKPPLTFGHECTGEVVEIGPGVEKIKVGDRVSLESHIPCMNCDACRNDCMHICDNLQILGIDTNGCFAEYVKIPEICVWKHSTELPWEIGSILEPLGNAVYATLIEPVENQRVLVMGCGPTGLFSIRVARAGDAKEIVAVDVNPHRRAMAKELGADLVFDGANPNILAELQESTRGAGFDVVLEMSGAEPAINNGLKAIRKGGRFTAFGLPGSTINIDYSADIIMRSVRVLGVCGRHMFRTWETMTRLIDEGKLDPAPVITHRMKLTDVEQAAKTLQSREIRCGKIVLFPAGTDAHSELDTVGAVDTAQG